MLYKKLLIFNLLCIIFIADANAGNKSDIYNAFINNDMQKWKNTIVKMASSKNKSSEYLLELVNYQYGYIAWCLGNKRNEEAEQFLDEAEKNIEVLEIQNYKPSMVNSYKAAFYGYRIGLNMLKAPFIGMKSIDCAKLAIKQDKKNPFAYVQYGNIQFYMPSVFGGSKTEAIQYYRKALELMVSNEIEIEQDWNYLSLLTVLAQSYEKTGDLASAKIYCEKILKFEPEFQWVKNELYPGILKKIKNKV